MRDDSSPDGWRRMPFSGLAEVNPSRPLRVGAMAPYAGMAAVREQAGGIASVKQRAFNGSGSRFRNGDTIFARITPCAENRKIAFVDFLPNDAVAFGSTEFIVLSPRPMFADPRFIFYLASWDPIVGLAVSRMTGTSGRQRVPEYVFREELHVLVPPVEEQRAIAEILSSVDNAIEKTEAVIEHVRRVKQGLAQQLLTHGLPGRHARFKQTEVGEIPEQWEVVRLGSVAEVLSGFALGPSRRPKNHPRPYLTVANVQTGKIHVADIRYMEVAPPEYETRKLRAGDIVMVEGHAQLSELGRAAIVPAPFDGFTFQNHLFRVRVNAVKCDPVFLCTYINGSHGRAYFRSFGGTTSGLNTVSTANVQGMPIPLPLVDEQRLIGHALAAVEERMGSESMRLELLRNAKSALMHVLLTGQVRVKLPTDPVAAGDNSG